MTLHVFLPRWQWKENGHRTLGCDEAVFAAGGHAGLDADRCLLWDPAVV